MSKFSESYMNSTTKDTYVEIKNELKRSKIAEHLVNNPYCVKKYDVKKFKRIKSCGNIFDQAKLHSRSTPLTKPKLCG